jgi:hypothetical protein
MNGSEKSPASGLFAELLHPSGRFASRLAGVLRFERAAFAEIEQDPHAIPQAFAVVIGTAVVGSLGQGFPGIFLGIAGAIVVWGAATSLVWAISTLALGQVCPFPRLLRCMGFAYVWFALLIGGNLPFLGFLFNWAAAGLCLVSAVMATRQVLEISTERAFAICVISFATPLLLLLLVA